MRDYPARHVAKDMEFHFGESESEHLFQGFGRNSLAPGFRRCRVPDFASSAPLRMVNARTLDLEDPIGIQEGYSRSNSSLSSREHKGENTWRTSSRVLGWESPACRSLAPAKARPPEGGASSNGDESRAIGPDTRG
jgi:hypothetical protein